MDITIIWDSVNVASRIENLTRDEDGWILFSDNTYNLIKNKDTFNIDRIWEKVLKWKKEKIMLYWINEEK
jgi:class 3 adenylate cyclase